MLLWKWVCLRVRSSKRAVANCLFIRRFRTLRERMISEGNDLIDRDMFDCREDCSRHKRSGGRALSAL
jgi:hypothetical protein